MEVELARRYGSALDAQDWETARSLLDPDVEVVRPSGRRYRGADRWIELLSEEEGGLGNIDSAVESREYEQRNGRVIETQRIVHRWRESGGPAYRSTETTELTFRDGRIARMASRVEHRAPE